MKTAKQLNLVKATLAAAASMVCLLATQPASAIGVLQAYDEALRNDPLFRSAVSDNLGGQQNKIIGRAGLLPTIQYSYSTSKNIGDSSTLNAKPVDVAYTSISNVLSVRQTLFNIDATSRYKQGLAQTKYSDAVFITRTNDLMLRLMSAYAEAKYSEDQLSLVSAQRDAFAEQKRVNDRMYAKGEGTITDMLETQAKLDVIEAQVFELQDNLTTSRNTLAAMIGREVVHLDNLRDDFSPVLLSPSSFDEWSAIAKTNNSELAAGALALEVAELEISKSRAGHAPRLDFNASYSDNVSDSITTRNQNITNRSIGVQLVIPIYSGGYVSAVSSQAVANRDKSRSDLDGTTKKVMIELRKQFNTVQNSVAKMEALQKSVKTSTLLVEATQQSVKGGVRINLDVLNSQQQLVQAKRDLALARYAYLIAFLKLRVAAGVLNLDDLRTVSGFFSTGS